MRKEGGNIAYRCKVREKRGGIWFLSKKKRDKTRYRVCSVVYVLCVCVFVGSLSLCSLETVIVNQAAVATVSVRSMHTHTHTHTQTGVP